MVRYETKHEVQDAVRADREQAVADALARVSKRRDALAPAFDAQHFITIMARDIHNGNLGDVPALLASARARLDEVEEAMKP